LASKGPKIPNFKASAASADALGGSCA
jgi:hypothetical protein